MRETGYPEVTPADSPLLEGGDVSSRALLPLLLRGATQVVHRHHTRVLTSTLTFVRWADSLEGRREILSEGRSCGGVSPSLLLLALQRPPCRRFAPRCHLDTCRACAPAVAGCLGEPLQGSKLIGAYPPRGGQGVPRGAFLVPLSPPWPAATTLKAPKRGRRVRPHEEYCCS